MPSLDVSTPALRSRSKRGLIVGVTVLLVLLAVSASSLALGAQTLTVDLVVAALRTPDETSPAVVAVVSGLRVPRTILALLTGACLGLSGALAQVHTRNPLADPGLLGVTSGAGLAVVCGMAFWGLTSPTAQVGTAVCGAAIAGALVLVVAARVRAFGQITTLVLTGAIASALLGSLSSAVLLTHESVMRSFQGWSTGILAGRSIDVLPAVAPLMIVGAVLVLLNLPAWPGLALGDALAAGLGRNVVVDRNVGVAAIVVLAAAATAIAGPIAFVGLLAPHLARRLLPDAPVAAVLMSAPIGAALLVLADTAGRLAVPTGELPVGVAMALIGAPVFVLIARSVAR